MSKPRSLMTSLALSCFLKFGHSKSLCAVLDSSFNLALPLQAFGSVSVFDRSEDFPLQTFGCSEALHVSKMWQDSKFDLQSVLKANFHEEFIGGQTFDIHPPFLFYIRSRAEPALIHLLGRILN